MNAETAWTTGSAIDALSVAEHGTVTGYEVAREPAAAQYLGRRLAAAASEFSPTVIASWAAADDSVLAHVVATELGLGRIVISVDLGLFDMSPPPWRPVRAVLVAAMLEPHFLDPVAKLLATGRHELAGVVSLGSRGPAAVREPVGRIVLA